MGLATEGTYAAGRGSGFIAPRVPYEAAAGTDALQGNKDLRTLGAMKRLVGFAVSALLGCGGGTTVLDAGVITPVIHDCTAAAYVDRSDAGADRRVGFGTALGSNAVGYSPSCIVIAAGQSVTFVGNFNTHPLVGGEYGADGGTSNNPIGRHDTGTADLPIGFPSAGLYPFYCDLHAPTMVGVVKVQ